MSAVRSIPTTLAWQECILTTTVRREIGNAWCVRMNRLGRAVLNSPARAAVQRRHVVPTMSRLGGDLRGLDAFEIGCGRGFGTELILDLLHAGTVAAVDIDPVMVRLALGRLGDRAEVRVGDMLQTGAATDTYDAVIDMGAIHIEPRWREALGEVSRIVKPGGRFYFEEIVRPSRQALSTVAVGRRLRSDFAKRTFVDELEALGFVITGLDESLPPALTGMAGDLIGVATLTSG